MSAFSELSGAAEYAAGTRTFCAGLRPQDAVRLPLATLLDILDARYGAAVDAALSPDACNPDAATGDLPAEVASPRVGERDSGWLQRSNVVGVNVRTLGSYAEVVKYALTLPASFDAVHLLPIWEPGVVESLYGIAAWNLSYEFYSDELAATAPHLDTIERQLRATSNLLHVMGKTVGMDVIPHTDRFSEPALANPALFEWMQVGGGRIVDHSDAVEERVENLVHAWLAAAGHARGAGAVPATAAELFAMAEPARLETMFGERNDLHGRIARRVDLIKALKEHGYEPVPATMGTPFRGIRVDDRPEATVVDDYGLTWHDYVITRPEFMSRVFSPLARFKLYERIDGNANWEIDFDRPRRDTWDYVTEHYASTQRIGNFDFMRGDMSHVQMRPDGVPNPVDEHYDILASVKMRIQQEVPHFGYFAESFLPARDVFQFGEELDHLDASLADVTLGDLQSTVVGDAEYLRRFRRYLDDLATRRCAPAYTVMTADKDDPRFDEFYRAGNELRYLTALLLTDMPSYVALGFEIRDVHHEPVENERYTKLFVFRERGDSNVYPSKARSGDEFIWGQNEELFERLTAIRLFAESVLPEIADATTRWLVPPDATTLRGTAVWTQAGEPRYVIATNADLDGDSGYFGIPALGQNVALDGVFSTFGEIPPEDVGPAYNGFFHRIANLRPGEGRVYAVRTAPSLPGE